MLFRSECHCNDQGRGLCGDGGQAQVAPACDLADLREHEQRRVAPPSQENTAQSASTYQAGGPFGRDFQLVVASPLSASLSTMSTRYPLSIEEEQALRDLGGFEHCRSIADAILREHGFQRGLFTNSEIDLIRKGRGASSRRREITFHFDSSKSLSANISDLLRQAEEVQEDAGGMNYVGAMLQHLVGAKLDLVLGSGKIEHHGSSVADHSTDRKGDFQVEAVVLHVTTHPSEALVRKCADNLRMGLKPVILTLADGVTGAGFLLKAEQLADRVDVLDVVQFLTANVYERSLFKTAACKDTLSRLLERYNEIIEACETEPSLKITLPGSSTGR